MLLSIIIPTKNRPDTSILCVKNVLMIEGKDMEVILHDCSDNDETKKLATEITDERLKYYKTEPVSMTENFNSAIAQARGEYILVMGDDDGIMPEIYEIAIWARANKIDTMIFNRSISYIWPNPTANQTHGELRIGSFSKKLTCPEINEYTMMKPFEAYKLPRMYGGLVSRMMYEKLQELTGVILDSYCPDVYAQFALTAVVQKHCYLDYPVFIPGTSLKSNSGRVQKENNDHATHLKEFGTPEVPDFLPPYTMNYFSVSTYATEALYKAIINTKRDYLLKEINVPQVFADCIRCNPSLKDKISLFRRYLGIKPGTVRCTLSELVRSLLLQSMAGGVTVIKRQINKMFRRGLSNSPTYVAENIVEAVEFTISAFEKNKTRLTASEIALLSLPKEGIR